VKELKADSTARGVHTGQDAGAGDEEYMDDVEGYGEDELGVNAYDDDFLSSDGENVADVTVDLLENEEFPDFLDQEEMPHALAMNTFDHELQEPDSGKGGFGGIQQDHQHSLLLQRPAAPQQQQQQPQQPQQQQQQPQESERPHKPKSSKPQSGLKGRKPEAFSRLPMPKSFQPSNPTAVSTPSGIPMLQHRHSQSGPSGPPPPKTRDPKPSPPENAMNPGTTNDYVSHKGSSSVSNIGTSSHAARPQHPSINTKHGYSSSISSANNSNNGPASAGLGSNDLSNVTMDSPISPKVSTPSGASQQSASNTNNNTGGLNRTTAEMEDFIREHRNLLRECSELTKRENKLLATVSLGMTPLASAQGGYTNTPESFMKYLEDLDEIVDEKLITIVSLSQKLKALREQT